MFAKEKKNYYAQLSLSKENLINIRKHKQSKKVV